MSYQSCHLETQSPQIQVTGQQVLDMFEKSLGSILQVDKAGACVNENGQYCSNQAWILTDFRSQGLLRYKPSHQVNASWLFSEKNRATGLYEKLDLAKKIYYLATNDFLAAGGSSCQ